MQNKDLIVKVKDNGREFELVEDFVFYYIMPTSKQTILYTIPKGYITDFSSVPKCLTPLVNDKALRNKASVLHDWLYTSKILSRKNADLVYKNALIQTGTSNFLANIFYVFVRIFGYKYWKN